MLFSRPGPATGDDARGRGRRVPAVLDEYADFFEFHGLGAAQEQVIQAFRAGKGADYLADSVDEEMVDALTLTGDQDQVAERIAAYEGSADAVKLSPPTHGLAAEETRAAQDEILALITRITGGRP